MKVKPSLGVVTFEFKVRIPPNLTIEGKRGTTIIDLGNTTWIPLMAVYVHRARIFTVWRFPASKGSGS